MPHLSPPPPGANSLAQPPPSARRNPITSLLTDTTGDGRADLVIGSDGENNQVGLVTFLKATSTAYGPSGFAISPAGPPYLGTTLVGRPRT
ncbi:FG-GAP repeat domain-containing protein [Streptomyces sp. NBC_01478]|uniref:FG-GAP repeat domain-containing protein n=1 Tax=Streptomyces sp. NBC_01478 TaxID=2903882 RepID=UPI002E30F514|nr:FG-GAP repeat protein [Streptomyces sp. NBC_01478]